MIELEDSLTKALDTEVRSLIQTKVAQQTFQEDLLEASKAIHDAVRDEVKSLISAEVSKQLHTIASKFEEAKIEMKNLYEAKVVELERIVKSLPAPHVTVELPKMKTATKQILKDALGERSIVKEVYSYDDEK